MRVAEFMSYKTFYYFLYDDSCLDLSKYKDVTRFEENFTKENGYTAENFAKLYSDIHSGTKDLALIKTSQGTIIFHEFSDHEYVKEFLKQNSKNKPCGIFGSHRVGDVYQIGIAENGEIKRYIFSDESENILEGKKTDYEKKAGKKYKLDEDGFFEEFLDEDDVYEYAKDFLPFNVEDADVEVLDFKFYKYMETDANVDEKIMQKIHNNLIKNGVESIGFSIFYIPKKKESYMIGVQKMNGKDCFVFAEEIFDLNDKAEVETVFNRALKTYATKNYEDCKYPNGFMLHYSVNELKSKQNVVSFMVESEDPGVMSCGLIKRKSKKIRNSKIAKTMIAIKKYTPEKFYVVYKYIMHNIF